MNEVEKIAAFLKDLTGHAPVEKWEGEKYVLVLSPSKDPDDYRGAFVIGFDRWKDKVSSAEVARFSTHVKLLGCVADYMKSEDFKSWIEWN